MQDTLKMLIEIQELDMKMIRLMRLKRERQNELHQVDKLRQELHEQLKDKQEEIKSLGSSITFHEGKVHEIITKIKKLESQQSNVKKVDEFNALTLESTAAEREKVALEQKLSDLVDKKVAEEEMQETIKKSLAISEEGSVHLEKEIHASISLINEEGLKLKVHRDELAKQANPELLKIYDRLLKNKKDRVVVPIENRTCSGCHIVLTAQHENLVRKGENLTFCEHCSRIHYWQDANTLEFDESGGKRRRRRRVETS